MGPRTRSSERAMQAGVLLFAIGVLLVLVNGGFAGGSLVLRETEWYSAEFLVTDDGLVPLPTEQPGDLREEPAIARELGWSAWRISGKVVVKRMVPRRRSGHAYTSPGPEEYAQAGPERAVEVRLWARRFERREFHSMDWPPRATPGGEAMPEEMVALTLAALAEDTLEQTGDEWLAAAVREGGAELPGGVQGQSWFSTPGMVLGVLLSVVGGLLLRWATGRQANEMAAMLARMSGDAPPNGNEQRVVSERGDWSGRQL